jgi:uncharacterized protein (DUF885 family)
MIRNLALVVSLLSAPLVAAQTLPGTFPGPAVGASTAALRALFDNYWEWRLANEPELATFVGRTEYNGRWSDLSKTARDRARGQRQEFLKQLLYVGSGNLTPEDRLSAHLLEWEIRSHLETEHYQDLVGNVTQQSGLHTGVFTVIGQMPTRTLQDYENIIARLQGTSTYIDDSIAWLNEQLAAGVAQPQVIVDLVLEQVAAQRRMTVAESPLLAAFRTFPDAVPVAAQARLRERARAAYQQHFAPAWQRFEGYLRETYRPRARASIALTSLPGGRQLYDTAVRYHTTTSTPADEIHELGLQEVARIEREMEQIARADGFTGPATAYEQELGKRPGMRFASKEEMIAYARDTLRRIEPALPRLFKRLPKMTVGIRPIPPDREAATASNYEVGTADGLRPAWFNMNTYNPQGQVKYRTEALVLHETMPGHHLQSALAREIEGLPDFRRAFSTTAFAEGWALYAESLGAELGTVYRDPTTQFGKLASEQFRAVRLVVDTGMHVMGWSRDRARDYFRLHAPGQSLAEIDRYIAWPGQALAYKMGELKITELRRRAEQRHGARFDIREFHDVVLRNGRLPLDLLEEQVTRYIADAR